MRRRSARGAAVFGAGALLAALPPASAAHAQEHRVHELKHELALDITVTAGALTVMIVTEAFKDHLAPGRCRWCDRDGAGHDVLNGVDRGMRNGVRWEDGATARRISDVTAFALVPATSIGTMAASSVRDGAESGYALDMLLVLEAVAVSGAVNQIIKLSVARERPFVHAMSDDEKLAQRRASDGRLSFYSGHTSFTFSVAAASGTIASLRDYRLAPLVWGSLVPMAALTGFLRMAGDRHYFTDVLTGALIGSAVGVLLPLVFHGRRPEAVEPPIVGAQPAPVSSTPMITCGGVF